MIIEQFLINKGKEIDNPISNWGVGFTAEVIREWIDLQIKVKKLIPVVVSTLFCYTCKTDVTYWADLDRHTCNCGRTTKTN